MDFTDNIYCNNHYGNYCIPKNSSHRPAALLVLRGDVFEPDTIKYMMDNCGDGDIVHAGTYFGDFLPALSKGVDQNSMIWAFEPNPHNHYCAKETIRINNIENINILNVGLGETESELNMVIKTKEGVDMGGSSMISDKLEGESIKVGVVRLDDIIPSNRKISILQLDVEGFEENALKGSMNIIKRNKPILILESVPSQKWFQENLSPLGYKKIGMLHENTLYNI